MRLNVIFSLLNIRICHTLIDLPSARSYKFTYVVTKAFAKTRKFYGNAVDKKLKTTKKKQEKDVSKHA